ncbi:hypothetical protein GCM10008957_27830 [Deinococcus ruber]|uniref:Uncharacterized protein n=1 Tax=Deinococcus ruber TaxID=1848197 RepID=A0A918CAU0_9DEIO|nr:hypothetical protein GCM10008957_27830 [Deinococcus ruber]
MIAQTLRRMNGVPLPVAAFKRELRPGRRLVCVHRSHGSSLVEPGVQPFRPACVLSVHRTHVRLTSPYTNAKTSYIDYPTRKGDVRLEGIEGGFILCTGERRNVYCWLPDAVEQVAI